MASTVMVSPDLCTCDDEDCPAVIGATKRVQGMSPRSAVAAAAKELPISPFVQVLANHVLETPAYWREGAAEMFLNHITHGQRREDFPHWYYPLKGIVHVCESFHEHGTSRSKRDSTVLDQLCSSYWKILDAIWDDLHFLNLTLYGMANVWMSEVANFVRCFQFMFRSKLQLYERKTISLLKHCWFETISDSTSHYEVMDAVAKLIQFGESCYPQSYIDIFFSVIGVEQLLVHFKKAITTCTGKTLVMEMHILLDLVSSENPALMTLLAECNFYKEVIKATRKELKEAEDDEDKIANGVLEKSSIILLYMLLATRATRGSGDFIAMFTEVLDNRYIVRTGATALIRAHKLRNHRTAKSWTRFFGYIVHIIDCKGSVQCPFCEGPVQASFLTAARRALEPVAVPTSVALGDSSQYSSLWKTLLTSLGITSDSVRERYRLEKKCCNLECPTRNSGNRSEKKAVCARCQSVYYCDRSCQKSDWPKHKSECARFSSASGDSQFS